MSDVLYPKGVVAAELLRRRCAREYAAAADYSLLENGPRSPQAPPGTCEPTPAELKELEERALEQQKQIGGTGPRRVIRKGR